MGRRYKKPLRPVEVIVAFAIILGLGYLVFCNVPAFFMRVVTNVLVKK